MDILPGGLLRTQSGRQVRIFGFYTNRDKQTNKQTIQLPANTMETRDGKKSGQAAAQIAEWLAAAWNGPAYDALAGMCFCSGRARPCEGAANVTSEMTVFTSRWRMRARPAGGVAEDASARAITRGLSSKFPSCILCKLALTSTHQRR